MKLIRLSGLLTGLIFLAGCKPPKFNQEINCPRFHAVNVSVFEYSNPGMFDVLYPDYTWTKVEKTECIITIVKAK